MPSSTLHTRLGLTGADPLLEGKMLEMSKFMVGYSLEPSIFASSECSIHMGLRFRILGLWLEIQEFGFRVLGSGFRVSLVHAKICRSRSIGPMKLLMMVGCGCKLLTDVVWFAITFIET